MPDINHVDATITSDVRGGTPSQAHRDRRAKLHVELDIIIDIKGPDEVTKMFAGHLQHYFRVVTDIEKDTLTDYAVKTPLSARRPLSEINARRGRTLAPPPLRNLGEGTQIDMTQIVFVIFVSVLMLFCSHPRVLITCP